MTRRIVVLTPDSGGSHGVAALTRQTVRALATVPGATCEVWALDQAQGAEPNWPTVTRSARGSRRRLATWALAELMRPDAHDTLVVAMHLHLAPLALPVVARGGRLAVLLLGIESWVPLRWGRHWALRSATLLAISHETVRRFRQANPTLASLPIDVCYPGVDPLPFHDVECCVAARRTAPPRVLIVGRMSAEERYKGHDELLDIWTRVMSAIPGATLVVAGTGDDRPRLEAKARMLGLHDHVQFLGRVTDVELRGLYASSALFAMPSRNEGFGLVYLEAMRAGLPCVVGRGAPAEIVEHDRSGWVVDSDDEGTLTRVIVAALGDRALLVAAANAAVERARRFSPEMFRGSLLKALAQRPS